jgi:ectoine hydroxylase-related dioxygenase (phytanoyl-CoA dioxygenase family)
MSVQVSEHAFLMVPLSLTFGFCKLVLEPGTHNDYLKSDGMTMQYRPAGQKDMDMDMEQLLAEHCPFPVPAVAAQGDVILYDARIIHWGGANARTPNRPVVAFTFSLPWYADPYNTGRPRNKQRAEFSPQWMSVEL